MPKSLPPFFAALLLILNFTIAPLFAECHSKQAANTNEIQVVVPFAVPVGVPVAPFAPYFYSYQQTQQVSTSPIYQQQPSNSSPPIPPEKNEDDSPPPALASTANPSREAPFSAIATHCATCHAGAAPKAGLSLEHPETVSAADRLKAIHAVITRRMPKAAQLSLDQLRAVITELTATPELTTAPDENKFPSGSASNTPQ